MLSIMRLPSIRVPLASCFATLTISGYWSITWWKDLERVTQLLSARLQVSSAYLPFSAIFSTNTLATSEPAWKLLWVICSSATSSTGISRLINTTGMPAFLAFSMAATLAVESALSRIIPCTFLPMAVSISSFCFLTSSPCESTVVL